MKKIALLLNVILLYGCSQQNQLPEPEQNPRLDSVLTNLQSQTESVPRAKFNELENAYLDLLLKDHTLNSLVQYAESSHVSDATCYDDKNEIPVCVAIDKQVEHLDATQNYSAYDVMMRYDGQHEDSNKRIQVLTEAESLLRKFQESK